MSFDEECPATQPLSPLSLSMLTPLNSPVSFSPTAVRLFQEDLQIPILKLKRTLSCESTESWGTIPVLENEPTFLLSTTLQVRTCYCWPDLVKAVSVSFSVGVKKSRRQLVHHIFKGLCTSMMLKKDSPLANCFHDAIMQLVGIIRVPDFPLQLHIASRMGITVGSMVFDLQVKK